MKHLIIVIGDEIIINENYMNYIYKSYEEHFDEAGEVLTLKKDKDLPFVIERLSKQYDFISIFSSYKSYATTAKIIATHINDSLVLVKDLLAPSKAKVEENSFIISLNKAKINLLRVNTDAKLPKLLSKAPYNFLYFCLLGMDKDSVDILIAKLVSTSKVSLVSSQLLDELVLLRASAASFAQLEGFMSSVFKLFSGKVFLGSKPIDFIINSLVEKELKISFAESCTGGLLASKLCLHEGVSEIFKGSLVTYSKELKHKWLGLSEDLFENGGVYSEKCVYFMLKGVFKTTNPDFALAISGVLGEEEDEGTASGVVYIGAMYKDASFLSERLELSGSRFYMREQAALACFVLLLKLKPQIFF